MGDCSTNCNPCGPSYDAINQLAVQTKSYARQALSAVTTVEEFQSLYLGAKATAPTTDNEGNPLQVGALYFNTTDGEIYVWAGSAWEFFGQSGFYLGPKASDPTTDNEGNPLVAGLLYFNTVSNTMRVYNGTFWQNVSFDEATPFIATGTTTPRNLVTRMADVVNVLDFGAHSITEPGYETFDSTAAIQAAIDAGNSVFIPSGNYRITQPITCQTTKTILGDSKWSTIITADFIQDYVIKSYGPTHIQDITIDSSIARSGSSVDLSSGGILLFGMSATTIKRVVIKNQNGNGLYIAQRATETIIEQIFVQRCKGNGIVIDDGTFGSFSPKYSAGIISIIGGQCQRINGCALIIGDPTSSTGNLSAYRIYIENFEAFYCGGDSAIGGDYVIKIGYGDNNTIIGSAVSSPQNQVGGTNTTLGQLFDGTPANTLVKGIYVLGKNNKLINNRYISVYNNGITIANTSSNTVIDGAEFRHNGTGNDNYIQPIYVESGCKSFEIKNAGVSQCNGVFNSSLSLYSQAEKAESITENGFLFSANGNSFIGNMNGIEDDFIGIYEASTQKHRFGIDGTYRALAEVRPMSNNVASLGVAGVRWTEVFAVNGTINTSDANYKQQIQEIPESLFNAWSKVKFKQYKFNHAVESKGESARWHHGLVAQEIKEAFESEGLNAFEYGVLCHDVWEDELDGEGNIINPAGEMYSVRYDEAYALESAYIRWKLSQL